MSYRGEQGEMHLRSSLAWIRNYGPGPYDRDHSLTRPEHRRTTVVRGWSCINMSEDQMAASALNGGWSAWIQSVPGSADTLVVVFVVGTLSWWEFARCAAFSALAAVVWLIALWVCCQRRKEVVGRLPSAPPTYSLQDGLEATPLVGSVAAVTPETHGDTLGVRQVEKEVARHQPVALGVPMPPSYGGAVCRVSGAR